MMKKTWIAEIWSQLGQKWASEKATNLPHKAAIYYISKGFLAALFLVQLSPIEVIFITLGMKNEFQPILKCMAI